MTQYMFSVIHGELDYSGDDMQQIVAAVADQHLVPQPHANDPQGEP